MFVMCGYWHAVKTTLTAAKRTNMAKSEVTSKKAASAAGKVLSNPKSSKAAKTAAASALTQRPNKKK